MNIEPFPPLSCLFLSGAMIEIPFFERNARTICHHEAGHAVISLLVRRPISSVEVREDNGISGAVNFDLTSPDQDMEMTAEMTSRAVVDIAVLAVSGTMAELLLHGVSSPGRILINTSDWRGARAVLISHYGSDVPLFFCQRVARAVLSRHWPVVTAIAGELEGNGSLSQDDVFRIWDAVNNDLGSSTIKMDFPYSLTSPGAPWPSFARAGGEGK